MRPTRLHAVVLTAVLVLAADAAGKGPKPAPCPPGRYLVAGEPLVAGSTVPVTDGVAVDAFVSLDGMCPPVAPKRLKANRQGVTQVKARWTSCTGLAGRVRLEGVITQGCTRLKGRLRAKQFSRKFEAVLSRCGDGVTDAAGGEECDDGNALDGDGCEATCVPTPAATTTTAPPSTSSTVTTTTTSSSSTATSTSPTSTTIASTTTSTTTVSTTSTTSSTTTTTSSTSSSTTSSTTTTTTTSTSTTLASQAQLALVAIAHPNRVLPGGLVTYEIAVSNVGTATATGVIVRMAIPNGSQGTGCLMDGAELAAGFSCDSGAVYEWEAGTLAPGRTTTFEPIVRVATTFALVPPNFATTVRAQADNAQDTGPVPVATVVDAAAPLQLAMHDDVDPVAPGATVAYTITFANRGDAPRLDSTLTATIPPGLAVTAIGDGGQLAGGVITWALGTLSPGLVGQRTFSATVADVGAGEPRTRIVTAALDDGGIPQASARASALTVVETPPVLALQMSASPDPVRRGDPVVYRLTVSNLGAAPVTGVTARFRIPSGTAGTSCLLDGAALVEGFSCDAGAVYEWPLGVVPAGGSVTVEPLVDTSGSLPAGALFTAFARVRDDAGRRARVAVTTAVDTVAPLQLSLQDGPDPAAPGGLVTYTLSFANRGDSARLGTTLAAAIPPGLTVQTIGDGGTLANGVVTWALGTLSPGAHGERVFTATVADLGAGKARTRRVTAGLRDTGFPQASARTSTLTTVAVAPVLDLQVTAAPDSVRRGDPVTYQVTVTNLGAVPVTGVKARFRVPTGTSGTNCLFDGAALVEGFSCDAGAVYEWTLGVLPAGGSATVEPSVDTSGALVAGSLLTAFARVRDDAGSAAETGITTVVDPIGALQLSLQDAPDPATVGGLVTYTLTFGNRGAEARLGTTLAVVVPPGLAIQSVSDGATPIDGVITWSIGTLAPGATGRRSFTATVTDLGLGQARTRRVRAALRDEGFPQASARAAVTTVVESPPVLRLEMTGTPDPAQPGTLVAYHLIATNVGPAPLTGVKVRLRVPVGTAGTGCLVDGGVLVEGFSCDAGAVYEWNLGTLASGGAATIEPSVDTNGALPAGFLLTTHARVRDDGGRSARVGVTTIVTPP